MSGVFSDTHQSGSGRLRQEAELLERSDPTRCVAFNHQGLIVDGGIVIGHLAREQHEHTMST